LNRLFYRLNDTRTFPQINFYEHNERDFMRHMKRINALFLTLITLLFSGCAKEKQYDRWTGITMGTTYSVRLVQPVGIDLFNRLKSEINDGLAEINHQMSPWEKESEISRFNRRPADSPQELSPAFALVVQNALSLNRASGGAFDPTLAPLIELWGFGPQTTDTQPTDLQLTDALAKTGCEKLLLQTNQLSKTSADLTLNLSAIAKGYGVDATAQILRSHGISDYLVEIGGEVVTSGTAPGGRAWQIGVEYPALSAEQSGRLHATLQLTDQACATSGNYHNYHTDESGRIYSHILDPRTGRPVKSSVASVTVIAESCMLADGIATALFVMGPEEGLEWVARMPGTEALFLIRTPDNRIEEKFSIGFKRATAYN
jgi:thiamine biosynthesis lipoprotein